MSLCRFSANLSSLLSRYAYPALIHPKRNTYIVKRMFPVPLTKLKAERPRTLKARHFVYINVEDTDLREPEDLQIVLTQFVDGVGDVGDMIALIPEYARNHFLLPQKAVYATPENIEKYADIRKNRPKKAQFSSIHAGVTMQVLSRYVIPVFMNPSVPWSVEKNHIHYAFRNEEFYVPEDCIELPNNSINGPDLEKEGKDFAVFITINNSEKFPVRCRLFHYKQGMETAKLTNEYYIDKNEPILEEQKELLEEMPMPEIMNDPTANISIVEKFGIKYLK